MKEQEYICECKQVTKETELKGVKDDKGYFRLSCPKCHSGNIRLKQ
jgi:hypothetical protein